MGDQVIDVRRAGLRASLSWMIVAAAVAWFLFFAGLQPGARPAERAVVLGLGLLIALSAVAAAERALRRRLLRIDHEGIRIEAGRRQRVRLAWTELAGVGVRLGWRTRSHGLLRWIIPATTMIWLELVPADDEAVGGHPELAGAWRRGRQRCWVVGVGQFPSPPPIGELVARWRPMLWRGEHTGRAGDRSGRG